MEVDRRRGEFTFMQKVDQVGLHLFMGKFKRGTLEMMRQAVQGAKVTFNRPVGEIPDLETVDELLTKRYHTKLLCVKVWGNEIMIRKEDT